MALPGIGRYSAQQLIENSSLNFVGSARLSATREQSGKLDSPSTRLWPRQLLQTFQRIHPVLQTCYRRTNLIFHSKVWDTHSGECLHTLTHAHIVRAVAFPSQSSPQLLATGGFEKKLRIFDLSRSSSTSNSANSSPTTPDSSNGASLPTSYEIGPGVYTGTIKSIVWGPDNNLITTASDDKKIRWWDLRSRAVAASHDLEGPVGTCELNNLSEPTLAVSAGKSAYFFSGNVPGQLLKKVKTPNEIASVALHAGARKFVTGGSSGDTWVRVYDFDDERELDVHKGHHGPIWSVSFSPDGKLYATGSEDGTVKLWKFCAEPYGLWR